MTEGQAGGAFDGRENYAGLHVADVGDTYEFFQHHVAQGVQVLAVDFQYEVKAAGDGEA